MLESLTDLYTEILTPEMMVLGVRPLRSDLGEALMNETSALIRDPTELLSPPAV